MKLFQTMDTAPGLALPRPGRHILRQQLRCRAQPPGWQMLLLVLKPRRLITVMNSARQANKYYRMHAIQTLVQKKDAGCRIEVEVNEGKLVAR